MSRISKVLKDWGYTSDGKAVQTLSFECDTISDLPTIAEMSDENIVMVLGSDAHIIQDDTKYMLKGDGVWVKQKGEFELSLDAAGIDYDNTTSGMTADNVQDAIDEIKELDDMQDRALAELYGKNANQQLEIDYAINTGAKNIFDIDATPTSNHTTYTLVDGVLSGTSNGIWANYNVPVSLPAGDYVFSAVISNFSRASGAAEGTVRIRIAPDTSGGPATATKNVTADGTILIPFSWGGGQIYIQYYYNYSATASYVSSFTASQSMIRQASITDGTFVPYAPSNRELYEMILQLQSAAGLRSTTLSLRSAAAPLENEIEEEVTEDEER